jgi:hypothetical protein
MALVESDSRARLACDGAVCPSAVDPIMQTSVSAKITVEALFITALLLGIILKWVAGLKARLA